MGKSKAAETGTRGDTDLMDGVSVGVSGNSLVFDSVQNHPQVIIVENMKGHKIVFTDSEDEGLLEFLNTHYREDFVWRGTMPIITVLGSNSR